MHPKFDRKSLMSSIGASFLKKLLHSSQRTKSETEIKTCIDIKTIGLAINQRCHYKLSLLSRYR